MKIIKHIELKIKTKKEGNLYAIIDKSKADDLLLLLNYLFFEYTRTDLESITQNLLVIDKENDDEVILHGNTRSLCIDLKNHDNFYICSFADYLDFEESLQFKAVESSFVEKLKQHKFDHFKINRNCFLQLLKDWHNFIDTRPYALILYQDKDTKVAFKACNTKEEVAKFIADNKK